MHSTSFMQIVLRFFLSPVVHQYAPQNAILFVDFADCMLITPNCGRLLFQPILTSSELPAALGQSYRIIPYIVLFLTVGIPPLAHDGVLSLEIHDSSRYCCEVPPQYISSDRLS